jgi:hypothetical protein
MVCRLQLAPAAKRARLPDPRRGRRRLAYPACRARKAESVHLGYVHQQGIRELILDTKTGIRSPRRRKKRMHRWTPPSRNAEQAARDTLSAAMWLHSTFQNEVWLWRGQADERYGLEPGMHTRVLSSPSVVPTEHFVAKSTEHLIDVARQARLDQQEKTILPDLALLAHLQHHGAATPLLDVSTDPLIALWMVAFANAKEPDGLDDKSGVLFGIRRPPKERWIQPLDARPYFSATASPSISSSLGESVWWYQAPDVTERLRIQRGSFLIGALANPQDRENTTLPLKWTSDTNWVAERLNRRGEPSNTMRAATDVFKIVVRGSLKRYLRDLLEDRSGLSIEAVYPTPWLRPFIGQFAETYGRKRPISVDIPIPADHEQTSALVR